MRLLSGLPWRAAFAAAAALLLVAACYAAVQLVSVLSNGMGV